MKTLRLFLIFALLGLQCSCSSFIALYNYADSQIPRRSKPEPGYYEAKIQYENQEPITKILQLEQYYDAQASVRGNHWAWRQVGKKNEDEGDEIEVQDERLGVIEFLLPSRGRFTDGGWTSRPFNHVTIQGIPYVYSHYEDGRHVYHPEGGKGLPQIALKYSVSTRYCTGKPPEASR